MLEKYLSQVVSHQKRPFTWAQFGGFIPAQTNPYPELRTFISKYGFV